jgi:hypothetical protein
MSRSDVGVIVPEATLPPSHAARARGNRSRTSREAAKDRFSMCSHHPMMCAQPTVTNLTAEYT